VSGTKSLTACRPVHPVISIIEGHVEAIIALGDDAHLFEQGQRAMHVIAARLTIEMRAEPLCLDHIGRIVTAQTRLSETLMERCRHLRDAVIPEVKRLYAYAEERYAARETVPA